MIFLIGKIYGIECLINHKIYVGQTIRSIKKRFKEHSKADSLIGRAIRKYGEENFVVVSIEECETLEKLNEREIFWTAKLNCKSPFGYNQTDGGEGTLNPSEETRAKLSKARRKRKLSAEARQKISLAQTGNKNFLGHTHSEETRKKISAAHKGKKLSAETKLKLSLINIGNKHTAEARAKISEAGKGRIPSAETRRKISESNKGNKNCLGNKHTTESKQKMSEARKVYWAKKRNQKN